MSEPWHAGLPDDFFETDEDRAYRESLAAVREGLSRGLGFEEACSLISVADDDLRARITDDVLKVLIAEEHFARKVPLDELSNILKLPVEILEKSKKAMFEDVEHSPIRSFGPEDEEDSR